MIKVKRRIISILLAAVFILLVLPAQLWAAPQLPEPGSPVYVQDYAGMLDEQTKSNIVNLGRQIDDRTGAQIVVVTVEKLGDYDIRQYANELFRKWGIGAKGKDNGVLLLVNRENLLAGKTGKVRIEVGYGLEGAIPDGKAGRILDNYVLPRWQQGDINNGIWQGYLAIAGEVAREYKINLDEQYTPKPAVRQQNSLSGADFLRGFVAILVLFGLMAFFARKNRNNRNNRWGGGGGFGGFGGWGGGGFGGWGGGDGGGFGGGSSGGGGADR